MKYNFNSYQLEFIRKITNIDASIDIDDYQEKKIIKAVESELLGSFDKNDMPTETTLLCDSIMDLIYDTKKEIYVKFKLIKIDGEEFTFIYNNADNENYGKFTVNINTLDAKPIKFAKADKGESIWLTLIRKDFFADKFQKYKETRKIDGKTYTINGK